MSKPRAKQRIYTDTSVIGGCCDAEFARDSLRLMEMVRQQSIQLLLSAAVIEELAEAPPQVQAVLTSLPPAAIEVVPITDEITCLAESYLKAQIVGPKWADDALHVAAASVARADAIVSWNFKHIVRLDKIRAYNRMNVERGYPELMIVTPTVVIHESQS